MLHPIQEDELMARFRRNDKDAFEQVFRLFDKALYYYTFKRIEDSHLAEDIVSECFMKLWVRHANFDGLPALKSFLYKTAGNAVVDYRRGVQHEVELTAESYSSMFPGDAGEDERAKIEAEVLRGLNEEIDKIPGKAGQVFRLFYFDKLTTHEIAERMGIADQTVLNHKHHAIRFMRTSLFKRGILFAVTTHCLLMRAGLGLF